MSGPRSSQCSLSSKCPLFPDCPRFPEYSRLPLPVSADGEVDPSLSPRDVTRILRRFHYDAVYKRILRCTGCETTAEAAAALGVRPWEIARARRKRRIPDEWFLRLYFERRVSSYWLLSGCGPEFLPRVPARDSRRGRSLEQTILMALGLCESALAASCAAALVGQLQRERKQE